MNTERFRRLQQAAKSTFKDVLTTGLRNCEDQSGVLNETTIIEIEPSRPQNLFRPCVSGSAKFDVIASWLMGGQKIAADQTCDELCGHIRIEARLRDAPFPVKVEWFRVYKDDVQIPIDLPMKSNTCPVTADLIGGVLCARVSAERSLDNLGCALVEIGPFNINSTMRQDLLEFFNSKGTSFTVMPLSEQIAENDQLNSQAKEVKLSITLDQISFQSETDGRWHNCSISAGVPLAQVDMADCCVLYILDGDQRHGFVALSQRRREIIVLCIRLFQALKICHFFKSMEELIQSTHNPQHALDDRRTRTPDVDLLMILNALVTQTRVACDAADQALRAQSAAIRDRDALEADMREVIDSYRSLMATPASLSREGSANVGAAKSATTSQVVEEKPSAIMLELENNRKELLTLKRKLAAKTAEVESWLKNSLQESIMQTKVADADEIARHLDRLEISTSRITKDDDAKVLDPLEDKQVRSHLRAAQAELEQMRKDKQFLESKYIELQTQQSKHGCTKCRTQSVSQRIDTAQAVHERELKICSDKMQQMKQRLEAQELELKNQDSINRDLSSQLECLRKTSVRQPGDTFTEMNRTMMQESTIRDLHTAVPASFMATTRLGGDIDGSPSREMEKLQEKNALLRRENEELRAENAQLQSVIAKLEQKLRDVAQNKIQESAKTPL